MRARLQGYLESFSKLASNGPYSYPWVHHHDGGIHRTHIVFGIMVHGDEVGSLPAGLRIIQALTDKTIGFGGRVTFFIGNPEAGLANKRFLESDLNRVFLDNDSQNHESVRARQIMPILDDCDVFIDFHQTILRTEQPFYIFPWNTDGWAWARALQAAKVWVTRHPGQSFSTGTMCADEYVRQQAKPGLTIELSEKGFSPTAEDIAYRAIVDALTLCDQIHQGKTTLHSFAKTKPDLTFYHTIHREAFVDPRLTLQPGLSNFRAVLKGDSLSSGDTPTLIAPESGMLLFPKYPPRKAGLAQHPKPKEIYRIIAELPGHPKDLYTDTQ